MKGAGRTFLLPSRAEIVPARAEAMFFDLHRWLWSIPGRPRRAGEALLAADRRASADRGSGGAGPARRARLLRLRVDVLPRPPLHAGRRRGASGNAARVLTVAFPADVDTDCEVQTIYFDESVIVRHDDVS